MLLAPRTTTVISPEPRGQRCEKALRRVMAVHRRRCAVRAGIRAPSHDSQLCRLFLNGL